MPWAYVITKDRIADREAAPGSNQNAKGRRVRSKSATAAGLWGSKEEICSDPRAERFSLYDDDGNCYYEGMVVLTEETDGEYIFAPLDWAQWNAGCTYMKMRSPRTGKMEVV